MQALENPLLGILVAAIFTALVQSSSATISLAVVMAAQGFVTLEAGIPIVFGAKVGTCVTAMLAAIGKTSGKPRARRPCSRRLQCPGGVDLDPLHRSARDHGDHGIAPLRGARVRPTAGGRSPPAVGECRDHLGRGPMSSSSCRWRCWFGRVVEWLIPDRTEPDTLIVRPKYLDDELTRATFPSRWSA